MAVNWDSCKIGMSVFMTRVPVVLVRCHCGRAVDSLGAGADRWLRAE